MDANNLAKLEHLSNELYNFIRQQSFVELYTLNHPIPFVNAINYIALLIYPPHPNKQDKRELDRRRFIGNALWLISREKGLKANTKKYIDNDLKHYPLKFTYKNAETNIRKAGGILNKRIKAWQAFAMAFHSGYSLNEASLSVLTAYAPLKNATKFQLEDDPDNCLNRFKKEVSRTSKGVIHLAGGYFESLVKLPDNLRNIKQMIVNPFWIDNAIPTSQNYLKSIILDDYLSRQYGLKSGIQWKANIEVLAIVET